MFVIECKGRLLRVMMVGSPISVSVSSLGPGAKPGESRRGAGVQLEYEFLGLLSPAFTSILCASIY